LEVKQREEKLYAEKIKQQVQFINKADQHYNATNYKEAKIFYQKALTIRPNTW
jgi:hypothetical protein